MYRPYHLGLAYLRILSIRTAIDYSYKPLKLAEKIKVASVGLKRGINVSLNFIGNLYLMFNQYDVAIEYFEKSAQLEGELENKLGLAVNYQNIGKCFEIKGKLFQALDNYNTSLGYNEEIDNDMGRVICNTSIAQVYLKLNRSKIALITLEPILPIAQKLGDGFLIAQVFKTRAKNFRIFIGSSDPLTEELETVELYMTIENIRFLDEINFNIHVNEQIDAHTVRVPSLILQPFLQNTL